MGRRRQNRIHPPSRTSTKIKPQYLFLILRNHILNIDRKILVFVKKYEDLVRHILIIIFYILIIFSCLLILLPLQSRSISLESKSISPNQDLLQRIKIILPIRANNYSPQQQQNQTNPKIPKIYYEKLTSR